MLNDVGHDDRVVASCFSPEIGEVAANDRISAEPLSEVSAGILRPLHRGDIPTTPPRQLQQLTRARADIEQARSPVSSGRSVVVQLVQVVAKAGEGSILVTLHRRETRLAVR